MGLPVYTDRAYYPKDINKYPYIRNFFEVGPKEFLNLVKNAVCTIGSSFHLAAFSILFKKDLFCINGDADSRMNNLWSHLGLKDRSIDFSASILSVKGYDYDNIAERMQNYKNNSLCFLERFV